MLKLHFSQDSPFFQAPSIVLSDLRSPKVHWLGACDTSVY